MKKFLSLTLSMSMLLCGLVGCASSGDDSGSASGTGSSSSSSSATSKDPNKLIVAQGGDAKSLNPQSSNDSASSTVSKQIYDTLLFQDENMNITPGLAEEYELSEDGLELYLKIREGIFFHNGEELKATDVEFTLEGAKASAETSHIVGPIDTIEILGDYELVVKLEYPFAPILSHLAHTAISILNEKAVTEAGSGYGVDVVVGTGPYEFVSWAIGDRIEMTRNDDYWNGVALIENLTFRSIPNNSSRLLELESGGIDIAYDIAPSDIEHVESSSGMSLIRSANFSNSYVGFNTEKAPFDNVKVRQAINLALDMETIIEAVYYGAGGAATGPIGSMVWAYNDHVDGYGYDPEAAKALLEEAGYGDGFSTTIWTNENAQRQLIAEIVQNQLGAIGISVSMETMEWGAYLDGTSAGQHEMLVMGWTTVTGDPDYGLYACFHSDNHGSSGNRTFYTNTRVDELLDYARSSNNQDDRYEAYQEIQELIVDDAPWVFAWEGEYLTATGSYVEGFVNNPAGHHMLKNVSFK